MTSSIAGKHNLLQSDRSARLFIEVLYHYRTQEKYSMHAFVVMPDHFHVLITVKSISIERTAQFIKGGFAFRAGKELRFSAPVWGEVSRKQESMIMDISSACGNTLSTIQYGEGWLRSQRIIRSLRHAISSC